MKYSLPSYKIKYCHCLILFCKIKHDFYNGGKTTWINEMVFKIIYNSYLIIIMNTSLLKENTCDMVKKIDTLIFSNNYKQICSD